MDGNGRWAKARGLERVAGHIEGVQSVHHITDVCTRIGVRYLSLYTFSEENWNRPKEEVGALMRLLLKTISDEFDNLMQKKVRIHVLGNRERYPEDVNDAFVNLEAATADNDCMHMMIMLSYSGKWDILQATRKLVASGKKAGEISYEDIDGALVTAGFPDPDLIIRTSGEKRISNYMLWQAAYTEFVFTDTLWPDFREEQFLAALDEYSARDRRYGKVK